MSEPNLPDLDALQLIEAFGGRTAVRNIIKHRFGAVLSKKQVDKWVERNSIPSVYLLCLQIIGSESDPKISIMNYTNIPED